MHQIVVSPGRELRKYPQPGKREILFGREEKLATLFSQAIRSAGRRRSARLSGGRPAGGGRADDSRPAPKVVARRRIADANMDVQERDLLKIARTTAAAAEALADRGADELTARLAAELLILAFGAGLRGWINASDQAESFSTHAATAPERSATRRARTREALLNPRRRSRRRRNPVDQPVFLGYQYQVIRGQQTGLRARQESDVAVLHAELYDDVATRSRADSRPWRPIPPGSEHSPFAVTGPSDEAACFSVVELESHELVGEALLWAIDTHNRTAHIGIALRPAFRRRGLSVDVLQTLCEYGFAVRGLQRLQIDTLTDNSPMLTVAARVGFVREGTLRRSAWVYGDYADLAILGLLANEWTPRPPEHNDAESAART